MAARYLIVAAAFALTACGQSAETPAPVEEEKVDRSNLRAFAANSDEAELGMFVLAQVREGPGGPRECTRVKRIDDLGEAPAGAPAPYDAHTGARVFSVDCGVAKDDAEIYAGIGQWAVILGEQATPIIEPCKADKDAANICWTRFVR